MPNLNFDLELGARDIDQGFPEVVNGHGVTGQEGGNEIVDVVAGGEAEDLGDDRGDGACRQAVAGHNTRLPKEQTPRLEAHHLAGRGVVLLPVHDDETTGGDAWCCSPSTTTKPPGETMGTRQRKRRERFTRR